MRGDETHLYKISKASEILGVGQTVLRQWDAQGYIKTVRTPGGMRLFDISSIDPKTMQTHKPQSSSVILYSRVSSQKQKDDLTRQQQFLKDHLPDQYQSFPVSEVSDIGSGINFKRQGLLRVLGLVKQGDVSAIVVASRDRLARFGFELIEWLCHEYGTQIVVLDTEDTTPESELGKDLMAIVQVYCCRWNGHRRYARQSKESEASTVSHSPPEAPPKPLGRMCQVPLQQNNRSPDQQEEQNPERQVETKRQVRHSKRKTVQTNQ